MKVAVSESYAHSLAFQSIAPVAEAEGILLFRRSKL